MNNCLIYLHGFRSSSQSTKAQICLEYQQASGGQFKIAMPDLPHSPKEAIELVTKIADAQLMQGCQLGFVGSSLGGFYATHLAQKYDAKAVVVNPSVNPVSRLSEFADQTLDNFYDDEKFVFKKQYLDELESLTVHKLKNPEHFMLLAQTADEVLDYNEAVKFYEGSKQVIEFGGNHSFEGFGNHLANIYEFLFA